MECSYCGEKCGTSETHNAAIICWPCDREAFKAFLKKHTDAEALRYAAEWLSSNDDMRGASRVWPGPCGLTRNPAVALVAEAERLEQSQ